MIEVRRARESDVESIQEIFHAVYGDDYAYPQYYDAGCLKKLIFSDETALLVAEEPETGKVLGTASVLLDVGAHADLVAEFGRLAVHPEGRGRGIGQALMAARIREVEDRLHVGLVENRCAHEFSQRISFRHDFHPVGLLPAKLLLGQRETVALYVRHFGQALDLRRNHPHVIPESYQLVELALENCHLTCDAIIDADAPAYPHVEDFELEEMDSELYPALLRFERGRIRHREVFGPVRLHYGLFQLRARHGRYLLARRGGVIIGAIGFAIDPIEKTARVFEVVSLDDTPIYFLFEQFVSRCRSEYDVVYLEADVSAFSPRMQRTLVETGFLPAAYIPAMVFHEVERLDVVRMVQLLTPWDGRELALFEAGGDVAGIVREAFRQRNIVPQFTAAIAEVPLFEGLSEEQKRVLAAVATLETFQQGEILFRAGEPDDRTWVLLTGEVAIRSTNQQVVGTVRAGECLGELMVVREQSHTVSADAQSDGEAMLLRRAALTQLIRTRPDIGMLLYRNLCLGLANKLHRMNASSPSGNPAGPADADDQ